MELVIVNGEIVLENGQYCTLDLEKVMYMAERTSKNYWAYEKGSKYRSISPGTTCGLN